MKEYKVQSLEKGKWMIARIPFGDSMVNKVFTNEAEANRCLLTCIKKWEDFKKNYPQYANDATNPTDFRIVEREVTEWEDTHTDRVILKRMGAEWADSNGKAFDIRQSEGCIPEFISPYTGEILSVIWRASEDIIIVGNI